MAQKFQSIVTLAGQVRIAAAVQGGGKTDIITMVVGDGNGAPTTPNAAQTRLVNEVWRVKLNSLKVGEKNKNWLIAEAIAPASVGGFWMRELGLLASDGTLMAVCNMAETYKPTLEQGSGRTQTLRMVLSVTDTSAVTLLIDDSISLATEEYVNDRLAEHEQSRNHPDATLSERGLALLSSTISEDETRAATPKAVKAANDNANGRVPASRKVNGLALTSDINLGAANVGAYTKAETDAQVAAAKAAADNANANANGRVPSSRKVNGLSLASDITLTATDVNALGTTTVRAQLSPGEGNVADANLLPPNAVSFVYNNAKNSPPFTGPLLDFSGLGNGYNAQIVAAYNGAGERIGFRTRNGDSKAWNPWYEIYHTGNKPTTTDINAIQDGTISSSASPPAWNAKSGMYNLSMTGSSQMIFHLNANYGSCPAAQFKFDYKNSGIWYRSARDKVGFEEDWSELLTHKGSLNITGPLRSSGEYQSTKADNFRIAYGGYGVFWRNDGARHYLMLTKKDDIYGGYSERRPFYVDLESGQCQFGHNVGFSANAYVEGFVKPGDYSNFDARYYTKSQTDTAYMAKTGAYTKAEVDSRVNAKAPMNTASKAVNGWWKCGSTGLIIQWGQIPAGNGERVVPVTFPVAFPNAVRSVSGIISNASENVDLDAFLEYTDLNNRASVRFMLGNTTGGWSMGGCWMAIGY